jgi:O-antigen/teichoic acid export membrane protein
MSGVVLLSVAASVPRALLERELRYGRIAAVEAVSVLTAAVCALGAGALGAGVWALVLYNLVSQGLQMASFAWPTRAALRPELHWGGLRPLLTFGGWVLATNVLTFFARNSDNLLIGAVLGAAAVGVYGLSYQFMMIPLMALTWPSSAVLFATLSRQRMDAARVRETVRGVFSATAALAFPAMAYLTFGLAFPAHVALSARWSGVPGIVSWLAPLGALQSITSYAGAMLMAAGLARRQFLLSLANTLLTVLAFALTVRFGLQPLVKTYVAVSGVLSLGMLAIAVQATPTHWLDVLRGVAPGLVATAAGLSLAFLAVRFAASDLQAWLFATAGFGVGVLGGYVLMRGQILGSLKVLLARTPHDLAEARTS